MDKFTTKKIEKYEDNYLTDEENVRWVTLQHANEMIRSASTKSDVEKAAPDMFEALKTAEIWLKSCLSCTAWVWDVDQHNAASETLEDMNKAIAKAEGKDNVDK